VKIEFKIRHFSIVFFYLIKATELIEISGNLESVDLQLFYECYRKKILEQNEKNVELRENIVEFLLGNCFDNWIFWASGNS
jgi:hypothetical protein